ncbi:MAG: hypothetical protein KUG55_00735 [Cycloclasticus sp.]|jgi:putative tryptophan/tyrosine transport system substrate-binding protein|nr:hypothetical protein [Cycloclasticus sp.]
MIYFKNFYSALILVLLFCASTIADDDLMANTTFNVTIFYPEARKPYSTFFDAIIDGIKDQPRLNLQTRSINKSSQESDVLQFLQQKNPDLVILLGGGFKSLQEKIDASFKTVRGASFLSGHDINRGRNGVSMSPDPILLFAELKKIQPTIKEIHVVFDPTTNGWLVQRAIESTAKNGITIIPHEASNLQQSALIYKKIVRNSDHTKSALWLLHHDPTFDSKSLLPRILSDAWKYKQVVISSNPSHVRRGALLSLLPDNQQIGKDLALTTIRLLNGQKVNIMPMQSSLVVANLRTAKHLSNIINVKQKTNFALTYPRVSAND